MSEITSASQFLDAMLKQFAENARAILDQRRKYASRLVPFGARDIEAEARRISEGLRQVQEHRDAGRHNEAIALAFVAGMLCGRLEKKLVNARGGKKTKAIRATSAEAEKARKKKARILTSWDRRDPKARATDIYRRIAKREKVSVRHVQAVVNGK